MNKDLPGPLIFIFLLSVIFSETLSAQETAVSGVVRINKKEPAPYASVSVYDTAMINLKTGTVCDVAGRFIFKVKPGRYVMKIDFLSFKPYIRGLHATGNKIIKLDTIFLEPSAKVLKEITVEAERSQMNLSFEKRIFTVGKDITSMGGSVLDVLNNVPSLMADLRGNISLRGSNSVRILINGQPSKIYKNGSLALQSLPAEMIGKIEVITNPSARYEAEGSAGIINIILKKNSNAGFHGNIGLRQRYPEASGITADLNYRRGDINWFFNGSISYNADPSYQRTYQRFSSPDTSYIYREYNNGNETDYHGDYQLGAEIDLSPYQHLSVGNLFHFENKNDYWNGYYLDSTLDGTFLDQIEIYNRIGGGERANEATLDYENNFGGENHKLTVNAEFDYNNEKELPHIREVNVPDPVDTSLHLINDIRSGRFLNIRADYVHPVSDSGKVEAGLYGYINRQDYDYLARERIPGGWDTLPMFNNNYRSFEDLAAAYSTLSSGLGPILYQLGMRAEYYRIATQLKQTGKGSEQSYIQLFPSIYLTYKFNSERSVQLSYSRRISRPDAHSLLPVTDYASSRDRNTGNPGLKPEYSHSWESQYLQNWESGSLLLSVYYRHRTGVIQGIMSLDNSGIMRSVPVNLAMADAWGIEISAEKDFGDKLQFTAGANLYQYKSNGIYLGKVFQTYTDRLTGTLKSDWTVVKGLKIQATGRYFGPSITIQGHRSAYWYLNLAVAGDLFNGNATLTLNSQDLFTTRIEEFTIADPEYFSRQRYWEPSGIRLNFIYRINEKKEEEED